MPSQIKMLENIQPSQMEIPSQLLLKWSICSTSVETFSDSSQWKYLLSSFSNEVHVLHQFL
jgi:hypothetical protein